MVRGMEGKGGWCGMMMIWKTKRVVGGERGSGGQGGLALSDEPLDLGFEGLHLRVILFLVVLVVLVLLIEMLG